MKSPVDSDREPAGNLIRQTGLIYLACVLQPVLANNLLHLVFQMKFEFFQTMFLQIIRWSWGRLGFKRLNLPVILVVLRHELAESLIRLHQVRFDIFLCVLFHSRNLSIVESPRRTGIGCGSNPAGSFTSLLKWRTIHLFVYPDFTMNVFS